ncbi:vacuolar protein sorting 54 [Anaeramoeba flamelloides]|uniref:Vacuolar protein sorting 54 n=1 Tax=Anaeramoeba flamelloides TaxID=1746091 RepID=A0ABQ8YXG8_9EUKA|nr:vacuolar protein sorting 54 [Anaeramoeba flamelloides]
MLSDEEIEETDFDFLPEENITDWTQFKIGQNFSSLLNGPNKPSITDTILDSIFEKDPPSLPKDLENNQKNEKLEEYLSKVVHLYKTFHTNHPNLEKKFTRTKSKSSITGSEKSEQTQEKEIGSSTESVSDLNKNNEYSVLTFRKIQQIVPDYFFSEHFKINKKKTFEKIFDFSNDLDLLQLQEELTYKLNIVEKKLSHEINLRSDDIFQSLVSLTGLQTSVNHDLQRIHRLRSYLSDLRKTSVTKPLKVNGLSRNRLNYLSALKKLNLISAVSKSAITLEKLLTIKDISGAYQLLTETRLTIKNELNGISCLDKTIQKLNLIEEDLKKLAIKEFTEQLINFSIFEITIDNEEDFNSSNIDGGNNSKSKRTSKSKSKIKNKKAILNDIILLDNKVYKANLEKYSYFKENIELIIMNLLRMNITHPAILSYKNRIETILNGIIPNRLKSLVDSILLNAGNSSDSIRFLDKTQFSKFSLDIYNDYLIHLKNISENSNLILQILVSLKKKKQFKNLISEISFEQCIEILKNIPKRAGTKCNKSCADMIRARQDLVLTNSDSISSIESRQIKAFLILEKKSKLFLEKSQQISKSKNSHLFLELEKIAKGLLKGFNNNQTQALETTLKSETWNNVTVPHNYQIIFDNLSKTISNDNDNNNNNNIQINKENNDKNKNENESNNKSNNENELQYQSKRYLISNTTNKKYKITASILMLIKTINEYKKFLKTFPEYLKNDVLQQQLLILKLFNSRVSELILGAGAILQVDKIKRITTRHLALSSQCVNVLIEIANKLKILQQGFPQNTINFFLSEHKKAITDFTIHKNENLNKVSSIMYDLTEARLKELKIQFSPSEKITTKNKRNSALQDLISDTTKLYNVLKKVLQSDEIKIILKNIALEYDMKIPNACKKIDLTQIRISRQKRFIKEIQEIINFFTTFQDFGIDKELNNLKKFYSEISNKTRIKKK